MSRNGRPRKSCKGCGGPHAGSRPLCKTCTECPRRDAAPSTKNWPNYDRWLKRNQIALPLEKDE